MSHPSLGIASAGLVASPVIELPMTIVMWMGGVQNPAGCSEWLKNPKIAVYGTPEHFYGSPCYPVDPAFVNTVFVAFGLIGLLVFFWPYLKGFYSYITT